MSDAEQSTESAPYQTVVIPDEPQGSDRFGGHQRVATGIVDLVRHDAGGRTIGLEGGWGSGKSTVVELVRNELETDSDHRVFVYDTWAHEGDPLRRSFLEALGEFLISGESPWINKKNWATTRSRLARRTRTTHQRTTQEIPKDGRWVLGSLFLVPVGIALMGHGLGEQEVLTWLSGVLFTVFPVLIAWRRTSLLKSESKDREQSPDSQPQVDVSDAWALLTRSGTTDQKTSTLETPDPTSIEFSEKFDQVVGEALSSHESRQLVIVLDNLDRVEAATALRTLSTLQAFFRGPTDQRTKGWQRRLWVVLPYDRSGLKELWNDNEELLELFLSKIRSLRFEVPPLILSDWRRYIDHLIEEAFPNAPSNVRDEAAHVLVAARLDILGRRSEGSDDDEDSSVDKSSLATPTPRNLIRVVNLMGTFYRSRPDIPLSHIAYYAVLRDNQIVVGSELLKGSIPTDRVRAQMEQDGQELIQNLAALHFNSDVEKAEELLLAEPLTIALRSGDVDETKRLFQAHDRALLAVLEQELDDKWAAGGGGDLAEMGKALVGAEAVGSLGEPMRTRIRGLIGLVEAWQLSSREQGLALARFVHALGFDPHNVSRLVARLSSQQDEQLSGRALTGRIAGISGVMQGLVESGLWDAEADQAIDLQLPGSKEQVFVAAETLAREDPDRLTWRFVSPKQTSKDIIGAVASWPGKDRSDGESIEALKVISASDRIDFSPAVEATGQYLADANAAVDQASFVLEMLETLEGGPDKIRELVEQGWLLHHLGRDVASKSVPKLVFHQLNVVGGPPEARQSQQPSEPQGLQFLTAFLEDPSSQSELQEHLLAAVLKHNPDLPFNFSRKPKNVLWPWAKATLGEIASGTPEILNSDRLIDHWSVVWRGLGIEEAKKHIRRLREEGSLVVALNKRSDAAEGDLTNIRGVLWRSIEEGPDAEALSADDPWYQLYRSARQWLQGRSIDEWKDALADTNTSDVWLAKALADKNFNPELDTPFEEALVDYADKLIRGEAKLPSEAQEERNGHWDQLPELLGQHHLRDDLARALIRRLANAPSVDPVFWKAFGDFLKRSDQVSEHAELLHDVIGEAVRRKDEATLRWAIETLEAQPEILSQRSRGSVSTLKGLLKEELKAESPSEAIRRLAELLGVKLPKPEKTSEEGT